MQRIEKRPHIHHQLIQSLDRRDRTTTRQGEADGNASSSAEGDRRKLEDKGTGRTRDRGGRLRSMVDALWAARFRPCLFEFPRVGRSYVIMANSSENRSPDGRQITPGKEEKPECNSIQESVKEMLRETECHFSWWPDEHGGVRRVPSQVSKIEEKQVIHEEDGEPVLMAAYGLLLAYEHGRQGDLSRARDILRGIQSDMGKLDDATQEEREALQYLTSCDLAHVYFLFEDFEGAREILLKTQKFSDLPEKVKAEILCAKAGAFSECSIECYPYALEVYRKGVTMDPGNYNLHLGVGIMLRKIRRVEFSSNLPTDEEVIALRRAVEIKRCPNGLIYLAESLKDSVRSARLSRGYPTIDRRTRRRLTQEAHALFVEASRCPSLNAKNLVRCGDGLMRLPPELRDPHKAEECYLNAYAMCPSNSLVNHKLGIFYWRQGDSEQAKMHLLAAIDLPYGNGNFTAHATYVSLMLNETEFDVAVEWQEMLKRYPELPHQIQLHIVQMQYFSEYQPEAGLRHAENALDTLLQLKKFTRVYECSHPLSRDGRRRNVKYPQVNAAHKFLSDGFANLRELLPWEWDRIEIMTGKLNAWIDEYVQAPGDAYPKIGIQIDPERGEKNECKPIQESVKEMLEETECHFSWKTFESGRNQRAESHISKIEEKQIMHEEDGGPMLMATYGLLLAYEHSRHGDLSKAREILQGIQSDIEKMDDSTPEERAALQYLTSCDLAHVYFLFEDFEGAREILLKTQKFSDLSKKVKAEILCAKAGAFCAFSAEWFPHALEVYRKGVTMDPGNYNLQLGVGLMLRKIRRVEFSSVFPTDEEVMALRKAVEIKRCQNSLIYLAHTLEDMHRAAKVFGHKLMIGRQMRHRFTEEAHALLVEASRCPSLNANSLVRCGEGLMRLPPEMRDPRKAEECYLNAYAMCPSNSLVNHKLGIFYLRQEDSEQAKRHLLAAIDHPYGNGNFTAHATYVSLMLNEMEFDVAAEWQEMLKRYPELPHQVSLHIVQMQYFSEYQPETGLRHAENALDMLLHWKKPIQVYECSHLLSSGGQRRKVKYPRENAAHKFLSDGLANLRELLPWEWDRIEVMTGKLNAWIDEYVQALGDACCM
ncbi:unnamed protein product [Darwinula stevensoni]|uniref:Uncharacterized protein n=1 Tax=Darwinula stevensoni TaxID=69355 RepID=A0A7R9FSK1_9CRUS|nr:unnamed protein product [Darwinula stevensoni]CAG0903353.1 unnamed protein product [Darwinula stevensoni]